MSVTPVTVDEKKEESKQEPQEEQKHDEKEEPAVTTDIVGIKAIPESNLDLEEHFEFIKAKKLSKLKQNQLLLETEYLSCDPYQRTRMKQWYEKAHKRMYGLQVCKVLDSTDPEYQYGDYIIGNFHWATKHIVDSKLVMERIPRTTALSDLKSDNEDEIKTVDSVAEMPRSYYLGAYGMPGMTAYYGLIHRAKVRHGENVLVSGAAGAVGSIVGQIAGKIYDCHTVGIAGSDKKVRWITSKLGFDSAINYKAFDGDIAQIQEVLREIFPNGIDIYFDNVGDKFSEAIWDLLNYRARVVVCGQISQYNNDPNNPKLIEPFLQKIIYKEIDILGVSVSRFKNRRKFRADMANWITSKKIKVKETIVEGFENAPKALLGIFNGENTGKMIVKCSM